MNVLLIGAGTMGSVHIASYQNMKEVKLVGIVDEVVDRAKQLAGERCPAFVSLDEAIAKVEHVDVIDVCVPTPYHKDYVLDAARLKCHVICEKPLARNLGDARDMIDACKEQGVKLFVGHVARFFPEIQRTKAIVESGKIGNIGVVRTFRGGSFPHGYNNWYGDFEKSGGTILDLVIHDFDYLRWILGDVERVYAKNLQGRTDQEKDYSLTTLRFKNGAIAHVEGSWSHQGFKTAFEFAGSEGIIDYDSSVNAPVKTAVIKNGEKPQSGVAVPESPLKDSPYYTELQHYISCIQEDREPIVTAQDAYKALEIALSALESVKSGKAVTMGEGGEK